VRERERKNTLSMTTTIIKKYDELPKVFVAKVATGVGVIINTDVQNLNLAPYKEFGERFSKELKLHKMFMGQLVKSQDAKLIPAIISSGEELALVYSEFKCEKCGIDANLQFHHLIQRNARGYVNDSKYLSSRYYWSNVCILCNRCHAEFHGFRVDKYIRDSLCISNEKINKLKNLYKINNLELNN